MNLLLVVGLWKDVHKVGSVLGHKVDDVDSSGHNVVLVLHLCWGHMDLWSLAAVDHTKTNWALRE